MKLITRNKMRVPVGLMVPSVVGIALLYIFPLYIVVYECFTTGVNEKRYAGFTNFTELAENKAFLLALENTGRFYCVAIPLMLILPMLLALAVVKLRKKQSVVAAVAFSIPMIMPLVSIMMVLELFFMDSGIVPLLWRAISGNSVDFYMSDASFLYLVFVFVFRYGGYNFIVCLAGRMKIKNEVYEAARLDGAGEISCFFRITLPLMLPTLFLSLIFTLLNSYKVFREAYMIGGNYPNQRIYMIQHFINNNLQALNYHRLAAASMVVLIVTVAVIVILFVLQRRVDLSE